MYVRASHVCLVLIEVRRGHLSWAVVAHAFNPSTWDTEKPCLTKPKKKKKKRKNQNQNHSLRPQKEVGICFGTGVIHMVNELQCECWS